MDQIDSVRRHAADEQANRSMMLNSKKGSSSSLSLVRTAQRSVSKATGSSHESAIA